MDLVNIQLALLTDELEEAIDGMLSFDRDKVNGRNQNQIIHQSGRYHANEKSRYVIGSIDADQYDRTRNQIRYALQQLLNRFPEYSDEINTRAQKMFLIGRKSPTNGEPQTTAPAEATFKILMLTSNPSDTGQLQLEKEHSQISFQIQNSPKADRFPIKPRKAVTLSQFSEALLDERPVIVHFSGHGELKDAPNDIKAAVTRGQGLEAESHPQDDTGIILTSENGRESFFVGTSIIRRIFRTMVQRHEIPIRAVLFNSCYSEAQAKALAELVPHVIGTSSAIKDEAAIAFANGFYSFLTRTEDIESSWDNGVTHAMAYGEPEERFIYYKNGEKII